VKTAVVISHLVSVFFCWKVAPLKLLALAFVSKTAAAANLARGFVWRIFGEGGCLAGASSWTSQTFEAGGEHP